MLERIEFIFNKETSEAWMDDEKYNLLFIRHADVYFEQLIVVQGFVSLYDIKKYLSINVSIDDLKYYADDLDNWTFDILSLEDGSIKIALFMKHF